MNEIHRRKIRKGFCRVVGAVRVSHTAQICHPPFEQLKIYYEAKDLSLNEKFATTLELLNADGDFNYAAYLQADNNGTSIKVAKYKGTDRVDLIENNEYVYCSLVSHKGCT